MNRLFLLGPLLLAACGLEGSASDPQLLVPDDVMLRWDESFNGVEDGLAALVPVDVMVYDGTTGDPLGDVELVFEGEVPGALLVLPEGVVLVDDELCLECEPWWDAWRDRYFELAEDEGLEPVGTLTVQTDETGLARVYVFLDSFQGGTRDGGLDPASVTVTMGELDEAFSLVPR